MKFAQEVEDISVKFLIGLLLLEHRENRIICVGLAVCLTPFFLTSSNDSMAFKSVN